ncbi:MAG: sigma-70 family RNA polymerase sigma factor [Alphaproteobacteria bacterium]|nr:MAG: sigma-70 family RNA polymerase sigma factor [Alphaproteobacteria bacterium]
MDFPAGARTASDESRRLAGTLAEVARGDSAAMADLYARTSAKLFGICLRVLGNRSEAEEALQETYVAVWRNAAAFDAARASPITWLAIVSRNKAIDRLRSRRPAQGLEAAAEVADDRALASELIEDEQERGRLTTCIEELEERQRDAIRSAFLDGATYSDLAERDGVPLGTMKSWIRRGLLRLRGCLER